MKIVDAVNYIVGNIRYKVYYSKFKFLIPRHVRDQIHFRISIMSPECKEGGSCKICGCTVTALQMTEGPCPGGYYPKLMGRFRWRKFVFERKVLLRNSDKRPKQPYYSMWEWDKIRQGDRFIYFIKKDNKILIERNLDANEKVFKFRR